MYETVDTTGDESPADSRLDVVCPFCAMLCDDLSLPMRNRRPDPAALRCPKASDGFHHALHSADRSPSISGKEIGWPQAIEHATTLLQAARLPVFHGLIGDLLDCKAALRLAERFGGVVDHRDGNALARNLAIYQDSGWDSTSLGEVRNRADLVVLVGEPIDPVLPRLREKLFEATDRLHTERPPKVIELTDAPLDILDQVRMLMGSQTLENADKRAVELHEELRNSRYPVFVPVVLEDAQAELIVRSTADIVRRINEEHRAALLMLFSGLGSATLQQAGAWHAGFGIRTSFAPGYPEQDLQRYAAQRLLQSGESDLLVWISSLSYKAPPGYGQPRIVFGHPQTQFDDAPPDVYLPVAVPGVHRAGFLHRADGLHMLPLRAITDTRLPDTLELSTKLLEATAQTEQAC